MLQPDIDEIFQTTACPQIWPVHTEVCCRAFTSFQEPQCKRCTVPMKVLHVFLRVGRVGLRSNSWSFRVEFLELIYVCDDIVCAKVGYFAAKPTQVRSAIVEVLLNLEAFYLWFLSCFPQGLESGVLYLSFFRRISVCLAGFWSSARFQTKCWRFGKFWSLPTCLATCPVGKGGAATSSLCVLQHDYC